MSEISTVDFDYTSVDAETASKLEYFAKTGKALIRKSQIQFIADFGKILSEARVVMAHHGNGKFVKWAITEFDISKDTVFRYANAWEKCLSHGATNFLNWSPTALYMLAGDEIPQPVQKKLEKLPATEFVRVSYVKRLIEDSKPPEPPKPVSQPVSDDEDPQFGDVPFGESPALSPADVKAAEKVAKEAKKEADKAAKTKAREDAKLAKEAAKVAAKAERDKAKAERDAEKAAAQKKKDDDKAAKEAARLESLTTEGQIKNIKNLINQHLGHAGRLIADLNRLKPNRPEMDANVKLLGKVKLW